MLRAYKALVEFFPGAHQLLPSRPFFRFPSPFREEGWDINNKGQAFEAYSYDQFIELLNRRFRSTPGTTGRIFHDNPGQDDWSNDDSGVQYLHIVGIKKRADTIGATVAKRRSLCAGGICLTRNFLDFQPTSGDGTVPLFSAERISEGVNLNAPTATVRRFFTQSEIDDEESAEHTTLTKDTAVQNAILSFLGRRVAIAPQTGPMASAFQGDEEILPTVDPALYLRVIGVTDVTVTDPLGNSTTDFTAVPGTTVNVTGEDSRLIIMDPAREYTVTFRSGTSPIALEITKGTDVTTTMATRYQDLDLPAGIEALLKMTPDAPGGVERLKIDRDGDGTFETEVAPTVEVEGPAAEDVVPPVITIQASAAGPTTTLVTLFAEDRDAGVKAIFFSLDGTQYQEYTDSLSLNPQQTPVLHAFADDKVGNRSSIFTFCIPSIGDDGSLTDNCQGGVK